MSALPFPANMWLISMEVRGKLAHRDSAVDGVAHGALHLRGAARVHEHHAAILVGAHQLRHLAACHTGAVLSTCSPAVSWVTSRGGAWKGKRGAPPAGGTGVICPQRAQRTFCAPCGHTTDLKR